MNTYISTFISGFGTLIEEHIVKKLPDTTVLLLLDGIVVYSSSASSDKVSSLPFFNNSFILLKQVESKPEDSVPSIVKRLYLTADIPHAETSSFRIFISKENELVSINRELMGKIENSIQQQTGWEISRGKAENEFWFMMRREGVAFFGMRLHQEKTKPGKGELKLELSYLLSLLSEPNSSDIFLDPFSGSGALPHARAMYFPYKELIAGDIDEHEVKKTKNKTTGVKRMTVYKMDALHMAEIKTNSIDKIVTDPPWGLYQNSTLNLSHFYENMLIEFYRVLRNHGIVVIVTARKELFEPLLDDLKEKFKLSQKLDILVSGKKAAVYKLVAL